MNLVERYGSKNNPTSIFNLKIKIVSIHLYMFVKVLHDYEAETFSLNIEL